MTAAERDKRQAALQAEYERLSRIRTEATEAMLRIEGAIAMLRELAEAEPVPEPHTEG